MARRRSSLVLCTIGVTVSTTMAEEITGVADLVMEDHFTTDGGSHFGYATVEIEGMDSRVYVDVDPGDSPFASGAHVTLEVDKPDNHARKKQQDLLREGMRTDKWVSLKKVIDDGNTGKKQSGMGMGMGARMLRSSPDGARSIIAVIMKFSDTPIPIDEATLREQLFGSGNSVNSVFASSSYGNVWFDDAASRIITVDMSRTVAELNSDDILTCPHYSLAEEAERQAASQYPDVVFSNYQHRAFWQPTSIEGCGWSGLANVGCSSSACKSWIRSDKGSTTAHELGHNLGVRRVLWKYFFLGGVCESSLTERVCFF